MAVGEMTERGPVLFEARAGLDRTGMWSLVLWIPLGCALAVGYVFMRNPGADLQQNLLIIGLTLLIVAATVLVTLAHLNARFRVTPTHVVKRPLVGRAVVVPRAEIAEAVLTEHYAVNFTGAQPRAFLLDRNGKTRLTSAPLREFPDVEGIAQAAPAVTFVRVLRPEEAEQRWPGMLPWSHAHPKQGFLLGVGIVVAVIALGILAAVIFG